MTIALLSGLDLAGVVVFAIVTLSALFGSHRRVRLDLRKMQATVDSVDMAVNNVSPGEPKLIERVIAIEATALMHADRLVQIGQTARDARDQHKTTQASIRELRNLIVKALERR